MPETSSKDTAIRQVAVPLAAPPYDDEPDNDDGRFAWAATRPRGQSDADLPLAGSGLGSGRPPDPDPDGWPSQFAQILAETLAGSRPARQLAPWTSEQARLHIRQLGSVLASSQRPRVRRVMTSAPASGVLELTAVVGFGPRIRVLALRLERDEATCGRWCCTAVDSV